MIEGISKRTGEKVALKKISAAQFIHNPHNQRICENEIHVVLRKVFHEFMNIYLPSLLLGWLLPAAAARRRPGPGSADGAGPAFRQFI